MKKATYGRMLLNEFSNMKERYNYVAYLSKLEMDRIKALNSSTEEDIIKYRLYKEHYLVRFLKQTALEIMELERKIYISDENDIFIDKKEYGNTPRYKNDLNTLRLFISKLDKNGYRKVSKVS